MLSVEFGREPTLQEMAERAGLPLRQALEVEAAARASTSLDQPLVPQEDGLVGDMVAGDGPQPEESVDSTFRHEVLQEGLALLGERERTVIALRFGLHDTEPKTLAEIGDQLGFSRERARQLETNALTQLAQLREMEPLADQSEE
jgi:RNA polymerase primary sigma factor